MTLPRRADNSNKIDYELLNKKEGVLEFEDPRNWRPMIEKLHDPAADAKMIPIKVVRFSELPPEKVIEAIDMLGSSFATKEPMCRFIRPPALPQPSAEILKFEFRDGLGGPAQRFGDWSRESLFKAFVRRLCLTDPTAADGSNPPVIETAMKQSLAAVDPTTGAIKFAMAADMVPPCGAPPPAFRKDDPVIAAVMSYIGPVLDLVEEQDKEAEKALAAVSPDFEAALAGGRVWHLFLIAKTPDVSPELAADIFRRIVHESAKQLPAGTWGLSNATNEWTARQLDGWNGHAVHYLRAASKSRVAKSEEALENVVSSPNGFLSSFDSGSVGVAFKLS